MENDTDEDLPIEKCPVDYISLDAGSTVVDLKVNGITIGSTIKDISAAFNEEVDSGFYAIYINDTDDYFKYITLYIEEDIVTNIIIRD